MQQREALNAAGVCDQSDRFNCKYCRRAGRDCEGYAGGIGSNPTPPAGTKRPKPPANPPGVPAPGNRGIIDELVDIYLGAAEHIAAGQQSSLAEQLEAMRAAYAPRHLVREEVIEFDEAPYYIENGVAIQTPGPSTRTKVWNFHYSDGDVEQVIRRGLPL